jgi:AcrR family transcriptional regulator
VRLRADAVRNTEKVLDAAREVFAERGLAAGIDDVAARAGVGKATVYRCWPTKELLVAAVAGARLDAFTDRVLDALTDPDATAAFTALLLGAAESSAANRLLHTALAASRETPELAAKRASCRAAMQRLIERGQEQGGIRRDITAAEVTVLFNGFTAMLAAAEEADPAVWRRYAALVIAATRP